MKTLYDLLGADAGDDVDALKKAFRSAVKMYHPDLHPGDPDALPRFTQIVAAYTLLSDATQRAIYDRQLQHERGDLRLRLERPPFRKHKRPALLHATAAVVAIGALAGGYGLSSVAFTTTIVTGDADEHVAAPGVAVEERGPAATAVEMVKDDQQPAPAVETMRSDGQAAGAVAGVKESEDGPTVIAAPKSDAVIGDADDTGKPIETTGARAAQPGVTPDQREPRDQHDGTELLKEASKPTDDAGAAGGGDAPAVADSEPAANDGNFYRQRGIAAYRSGDFLGAIGNFDEAIRINPDDAQSYNVRGNAWDEIGVVERALADYDQAIRIDPNNAAVFRDRAILWQRKGALDEALVDLDRAVRLSFADANVYCDRGLIWYQKGRHDRAIADFDRAIKLDPGFAAAYLKSGLILHSNRESDVAFADSKAIRVDPGIFNVKRERIGVVDGGSDRPLQRSRAHR